jgi:hypothetical protein
MRVLSERGSRGNIWPAIQEYRWFWLLPILILITVAGIPGDSSGLQKHTLLPEGGMLQPGSGDQTHSLSAAPLEGHGSVAPASPQMAPLPGPEAKPRQQTEGQAPSALTHPQGTPAPSGPGVQEGPGVAAPVHPPAGAPAAAGSEHAQEEAHAEHGPPLPEVSPIPGVTFVQTMIDLMSYELHGRFFGWRPNDLIVGRFTDNVNNYQLGVLEALRFTTFRLKENLTRMGDADAYDPDLENALNLFMNSATLFWFPSSEGAYSKAVDHLKRFQDKLKSGQGRFYYRVDSLLAIINTYKDILGNVDRNLVRSDVPWSETDDYFYYAKGVAHVYYEILRVVRVSYEKQLTTTLNALEIMDEINHELYRVELMDPWIVLDSDLGGIFANHRANLNAPLSEVTHMLGIIGRF